MKISRVYFFVFLYLPFFLMFSLSLTSSYVLGDQLYYRHLYSVFSDTPFQDVMDVARRYVSAGEPVSSYILWLGAVSGLDKDLYISLANSLLFSSALIAYAKYKVNPLIVFFLVVNFYFVVLMTGAERLKFAYIFLFLALIPNGKSKYLLLFGAFASHFQSLIILPVVILNNYYSHFFAFLNSLRLRGKSFFLGGFLVLFFMLFLVFFQSAISFKFNAYFQGGFQISSLLRVFALYLIVIILAKNKIKMSIAFFYFVFVVSLVGGDRGNMMAFTGAVYLLMTEGRLRKIKVTTVPLLMVFFYFSLSAWFFVSDVYEFGNGFHRVRN